jgi:hypothetical protein
VGFFGMNAHINESNGSDVKVAAYEEILRYLGASIYSYSKNRKSAIIVNGTDKMTDDEIKLGSTNRNSEKSPDWIDISKKPLSAPDKNIKAATEANITMIFLK